MWIVWLRSFILERIWWEIFQIKKMISYCCHTKSCWRRRQVKARHSNRNRKKKNSLLMWEVFWIPWKSRILDIHVCRKCKKAFFFCSVVIKKSLRLPKLAFVIHLPKKRKQNNWYTTYIPYTSDTFKHLLISTLLLLDDVLTIFESLRLNLISSATLPAWISIAKPHN